MSTPRLSPTSNPRYPKRLRGRAARSTAEAAINSVRYNTVETFESSPMIGAALGAGAATGTAGDINVLLTGKNAFEYAIKGTQTITAPAFASTGLDIGSLDQTADDGLELTQGGTARSKSAFTVGTDGPFYFECQFLITDVSGTDDCAVGFRKAEAYQANVDDYDELACLNVIAGNIKVETIINNAATVTTDTTDDWADLATKTLRVQVARDGKVSYKIDGAPPTVQPPQFTFDAGEVVVPFLFFLQDTDIAGACPLKAWNCGLV